MTENYWDRAFFAALQGLCANSEVGPDRIIDEATHIADRAAATLEVLQMERQGRGGGHVVVQIVPAAPGWRTAWVRDNGTIYYQCIAAWALSHRGWDEAVDENIYPVVIVDGAFMGRSTSRSSADSMDHEHDVILSPGEDMSQEDVDEILRRETARKGSV